MAFYTSYVGMLGCISRDFRRLAAMDPERAQRLLRNATLLDHMAAELDPSAAQSVGKGADGLPSRPQTI